MDCSTAAVPEESMDCSTAAYPPRSIYRDSIRQVAVSGTQIRSPLFSRSQISGHNGSSYSSDYSASTSYPSNNSGSSSGSALSAAAADFGVHELKTRGAHSGWSKHSTQHSYPIPEDGSQWQLRLQDNSGSSLQGLVERWIRGLIVIVHSIVELLSTGHEMTAVKRFGEASTSKMLVFLYSIVPGFKPENLRAALDMNICVCWAFDNMIKSAELVDLKVILLLLSRSVFKLKEAISITMEKVRTLIENDSWAVIDIPQGGGEIHSNTRLITDCIVALGEAEAGLIFVPNKHNVRLSGVRDDTIGYLKDMLMRKSELFSDPTVRYLFMLNNSNFVAHTIEPCEPGKDRKLTPECEKYMDRYLDLSWGQVMSCIPKSHFPGLLHRWINTSSLVKLESEFNKTYQAQKFWKVPDPQLRDALRRAITGRVVSSYRDYLKEHPELAEYVSRRNSTPEVLEEMLGQLFEG
ncbi:hypothetical protein ACQ4PT_040969 [Festuca glaucescens]